MVTFLFVNGNSDLRQFFIALKYQLKSYLRTKRFAGLSLFTVAVTSGVCILIIHDEYSMFRAGTDAFFFYNYMEEFSVDIAVIIAAFFGGDLISSDTGTNAAYYSLIQPVRRSVLFLGRYTAALIASYFIVFLYFLGGIVSSFYLYGMVTPLIFNSLGILLILLAATLSLASVFSALFKKQSTGIAGTVLLLFIGFPVIDAFVGIVGGVDPWFSFDFAGEVIYLIFNNGYSTGIKNHIRFDPFYPAMYQGLEVLIAYLLICGIISIIIYKRKQIESTATL